jgi:hypothetical protein
MNHIRVAILGCQADDETYSAVSDWVLQYYPDEPAVKEHGRRIHLISSTLAENCYVRGRSVATVDLNNESAVVTELHLDNGNIVRALRDEYELIEEEKPAQQLTLHEKVLKDVCTEPQQQGCLPARKIPENLQGKRVRIVYTTRDNSSLFLEAGTVIEDYGGNFVAVALDCGQMSSFLRSHVKVLDE